MYVKEATTPRSTLVMYKSKLQELCQERKWALPKYSCLQRGPNHCPEFAATVVVAGAAFHSPGTTTSLRKAQNDAAHMAFLHFTSKASNETIKPNNASQNDFKKKLEMYAMGKNLDSPIYHTEKTKDLRYMTLVYVGNKCYHIKGHYETPYESEHAAAQAALLSLSATDAFQKDDPRSYKILLHELTESQGLNLPEHTTTVKFQVSEFPTFTSTVEVEREVFKGAVAKTSAANAANTVLMERKLFQLQLGSIENCDCSRENSKSNESQSNISSHQEKETRQQINNERTVMYKTVGKATLPNTNKHKENNGINDSVDSPCYSTDGSRVCSDSSMERATEMESYLLCNKVRVFTCMPSMLLPKGTVILPITEDKWTIVSLECPCAKKM
ncbi:double-stranded RNA-binding protein 1-like [Andrographis paniculata]|uniref:double-stranded RNA-binding protein 1-like n=1 Tax=Andrographis paniculata TaxID=175694 RepID=UPI0021E70921|nr:double-stranded RNA-binding protein 1-like [Andrographis paniculata]